MKNLLFILSYTGHGGTNKSLENLLNLIDKQKYNIKIVCSSPAKHGLYKEVFKNYLIEWPVWFQYFLNNTYLKRVGNLFHRYFNTTIWYFIYRYAVNTIAKRHNIDVVVGYEENRPNHIACSYSGKSVVWVHCVYSVYVEIRKATDECCYHRADRIICVSKHAADIMKEILPNEAHKIRTIYNLLDIKGIVEKSLQPIADTRFKGNKFSIVSIGRYSALKQFEMIPDVAKKLVDDGISDFCWYIIGDGDDELMQITERKIKEWDLDENIIILGCKDNPYPYIAKSNLLVSTSLSESFSLVLHEALVLHVPVVSNDFPVATELINRDCGIVCPLSNMHEALGKLIQNKEGSYSSLLESCNKQYYDNTPMLRQIDDLFCD